MDQNKMNVDTDEIDKFSRLAQGWWDREGEFKALHDINPLRLNYIHELANLYGKTVLDVGCGGGILSESIAKLGAQSVIGIDMAEKSLQIAQVHAQQNQVDNVSYCCVSVEDFAIQKPRTFDVVTCMEMLEHVPEPASIIRACAKLVKPDGMVFFSTINRNPKSYLHAIVGAEYILNIVAKGTHDWKRFITPAELARMCRLANLCVVETKGLGYNPVLKNYFLKDDVSVNYMLACRLA